MNSIGFTLPQLGPTNPLRWIPPPPPPAAAAGGGGGGRRLFHHLHHQQRQRRRRRRHLSPHSYRHDQAAAATEASTTSSAVDDSPTKSPSPHSSTTELADRPHHPNSALPLFWEELIEKVIYRCRFLTAFGIVGSLMGSILCFLKGCVYIFDSFGEYFVGGGQVILLMVEAIDVYLIGTVMLVFGMGLYELFISNLDIAKTSSHRSNLLGLFKLSERPKWLEIQSVNELKTKLGHVIVMVLLVGMFEKSKKVTISSTTDLLCFAASILLSSTCLYLLSKLQSSKQSKHA